ncbi:hypothetical protein [Longimicrobium sp.]|uniref:hypothetical protein n=1 Tax=Longimicrobium sp. TaxID=2029185 RepID=UPI002C255BC9|nr:hypothetical protein [Longimicrobium sp.]HSU13045.1 hypothetical protein [Longimicrobium sp.]
MSEYQYYEFQAIDRPLIREEMRTLRGISSRATITPGRFVNEYNWGSFKGNAFQLMELYFDAFLYFANWGTHELMLRLPSRVLDAKTAGLYCPGDLASSSVRGDHVILAFTSEDEGADWLGEDDGVLASILPVRAEIASGDHRALYLGWLLYALTEGAEDHETEPPVPPGLGELTAAQEAFADFLRIDDDWIAAAAELSPAMRAEPDGEQVRAWVAALGEAEKTDLLVRVARGEGGLVAAELTARMRARLGAPAGASAPRTVGELREAAERRAEERSRAAAERAAREKARKDAEMAAARERYLDGLAGMEREMWAKVEEMIATKQPKRYDEAVALLVDLRDLGARDGRAEEVLARIEEIRVRHEKKPSFLQRLAKAIPPRPVLFGEIR